MTFSFASLWEAIESLFKVAHSAPDVVAQSADAVVTAAAPVIDSIAGAGTAAKVTHQIDETKQQVVDFITPHLAQAEMAETVAQGVTAILTTGAAKSAQAASASGQINAPGQPQQPAPTPVSTDPASAPQPSTDQPAV